MAQKLANLMYSVIEAVFNKLMIWKTFWKNIVLPLIHYRTNIMTNRCGIAYKAKNIYY